MERARPAYVVGIGGSAGSLEPFKLILEGLPPDTGMAFVFILHLLPNASSQLAALLSRRTAMPVAVATDGMRVLANHVYVIAPDADLLLAGDAFRVISPRTGRNKQVDAFFASLGEAMGPRAIGVVVSGYDADGTRGTTCIRQAGGITFAQDGTAEVADMPHHAQASGCVDHVLSPARIARELARIARRAGPPT